MGHRDESKGVRRAKKEVSRVEAKFKFKIKNKLLDLKFFSCPGLERRPSPSMAALPPLTVRPLPPLPPLSANTPYSNLMQLQVYSPCP